MLSGSLFRSRGVIQREIVRCVLRPTAIAARWRGDVAKEPNVASSGRVSGSKKVETDLDGENTELRDSVKDVSVRKDGASLVRLLSFATEERWRLAAAVGTVGVTSSISLFFPYALGRLMDVALDQSSGWTPGSMALALGGLFVVQSGLMVFRGALLTVAGERIAARLRERTFESLLRQEVGFFDANRTGELINRLSSDVVVVQKSITGNVTNALRSSFMTIGGVGMLFYLSPSLAALSLVLIPPVGLGGRYLGRYVKERQEKVQARLADTLHVAEELVSNVRTVRLFGSEPREAGRFSQAVRKAYVESCRVGLAQSVFDGGVHMAANMAIIAVLFYGGTLVETGAMSAGDLTSFLLYALYMGFNLSQLTTVYTEAMRGLGASSRIVQLIDRQPESPTVSYQVLRRAVNDASSINTTNTPASKFAWLVGSPDWKAPEDVADPGYPTKTLEHVQGDVLFDDISFAYPLRPTEPIFRNLSLHIPAGTSLAIAGPSGTGKSTLAGLLARLYDPQHGSVRLDGHDISTLDPLWLRQHVIGVVPQDPALFAASIYDNIRYGAPSDTTHEQVLQAASIARVDDFVNRLDNGFDTLVGERGVQLSGGQRQRVAIARAILRNTPVLVFDEATSALDAESEAAVSDALLHAMQGRTVISIAHRLSTLRSANRVAVLAPDGSIAEHGPIDELLSKDPAPHEHGKDGSLRRLLSRQLLD